METPYPTQRPVPRLSRRDLLQGRPGRRRHAVYLAPVSPRRALGGRSGATQARRHPARARAVIPPHFDPHLTR